MKKYYLSLLLIYLLGGCNKINDSTSSDYTLVEYNIHLKDVSPTYYNYENSIDSDVQFYKYRQNTENDYFGKSMNYEYVIINSYDNYQDFLLTIPSDAKPNYTQDYFNENSLFVLVTNPYCYANESKKEIMFNINSINYDINSNNITLDIYRSALKGYHLDVDYYHCIFMGFEDLYKNQYQNITYIAKQTLNFYYTEEEYKTPGNSWDIF